MPAAINCVAYESKAGAQPSEKPQSRFGGGQIRAAAVVIGDAVKPIDDEQFWQVPARELLASRWACSHRAGSRSPSWSMPRL
jgi:hypothetical protein